MDAASKAAVIAACEETYSGFSQDTLELELVRQIKLGKGHAETRKDYMDSYKELVDECALKVDYIVGKIDAVQHEVAVATHLENGDED